MRFCCQCQRTQNKRIGRDCMCDVKPAPDSTDPSARTVSTDPNGTKRRRLQKRVDELQTKPMRRHRVIEICACAMAFAAVAPSCGWKSVESVSHESGRDLYIPEVCKKALEELKKDPPDVVILAPECTPWSQMQNLNAKNPNQAEKLRVARDAEREVWKICSEIRH